MSRKLIEGQDFSCGAGYQDKFLTSCALGLSWRPGREKIGYEIRDCLIDGSRGGEGLKLSFCYDVYVEDCTIIGGVEDCVDIVRGGDISFYNCRFVSKNTKHHITAKGGVKSLSFTNCNFVGDYRMKWDGAFIDLGNWTDYDDVNRPGVREVSLNNCRIFESSRKILCRRLYSENPSVKNCDGKILKIPKILLALFWWGQRFGLLGTRRRLPEKDLKVYDFEL
tara:strand:- start:29383 stop:30051 length:669 start_codon:yes stop_codon:yes gene_type:complete